MAHRRSKGRHRGASGRANTDLDAHIRSLQLDTVGAYQAWCRAHGFSGALNKSWQERRQERKVAEQAVEDALVEKVLQKHIQALGLATVDDYVAWCQTHGLSSGTQKSASQRKKELALYDQLKSEAALAKAKTHTRRPQEMIRAIYAGESVKLKSPHLEKIQAAFDRLGRDRRAREAFLQLLLHVEKRGDFFDVKPAVTQLGPQAGNTWIDGLAALARWHKRWLHDPTEWRPESHNVRKQFGALARHLLAKYAVPVFMDTAWFWPHEQEAEQQQGWFVHVGCGQNIRKADVPVPLTKMMAHLFLQAPDEMTLYEAFRWGQVLGLGGDDTLVRMVNGTRLGASFEHADFWHSVLHFFVNNPMLDPDQVGPLVDYIHQIKFVPREETMDGEVVALPPERPNFSVKGRSMDKLLWQMDMWHRHLAREERLPARVWAPSGLGTLAHTETDRYGREGVRWDIVELLNAKELAVEGRTMHHCVRTYANNCKKGNTSIWSMQVTTPEDETHRVMTIAVNNSSRSITQARGKCNALPNGRTPSGKRRGFNKEYERYLRHSRKILFLWREQEGLSMSSGV